MPSVGEKQHPHKHTEHTLSGTKGEYSNEKFLSIFIDPTLPTYQFAEKVKKLPDSAFGDLCKLG